MRSVSKISLVFVIMLSGMAGCIKPVDRTPQPPVELSDEFSITGSDSVKSLWWEEFNDSTLNSLVQEALNENMSLKSAWSRLDQSQAIAHKAGADLYPQLSGQAGASQTSARTAVGRSNSTEFSLGLAVSYEVDLWGKIKAGKQAAEYDLQASRYDLDTAAITLVSQVAEAWYSIIAQRKIIAILDDQIQTNEKYLKFLEFRFRQGQAIAIDVLQQRQQLEATAAERVLTVARLQVFENQLAVLLGKSPGTFKAPDGRKFPVLGQSPDTGLPIELVTRRPDIKASFAKLRAADNSLAAAIADRYPALSLTAGASTSAEKLKDLFDNWLVTIAANAVAPILDGDRRKAEVQRTRAVVDERLWNYSDLILNAIKEVEDSLINEKQQKIYIANQNRQLELLDKVVKQSHYRYANGALDYLRVLDSLEAWQILEIRNLDAQRDLIGFRITLYRALAGGWEMERAAEKVVQQ